ncbi:alpha/beta-hydrolase [Colletotrichum eremochloae]|nr:alpha/beta-hydrolase [Colletotrichum eremochloae]
MASYSNVEFRTADGVILRGLLLIPLDHGQGRGPGIAMLPGFNAVKEMVGVPSAAQHFQDRGFTVLLFDPRSVGQSDGTPRNDIDPFQQTEDLGDALSFLAAQPSVDTARLGVWGMSLGGAVALCTACFDTRVRFVIGVCPAVEYRYDAGRLPKVLAKATRDRESRVKGNEPFYVPMMDEVRGENPAGFDLGVERAAALRILGARNDAIATRTALAPGHVNRTTIRSYLRLLMWRPANLWPEHLRVPALFVVPENDALVGLERNREVFDSLKCSKSMHVEPGRGHLDILEGENLAELMAVQSDFALKALERS